ncbi:flavin reductase [Oceanobacillus piezotolerans]|uniref:Flavin reductase n=1 Tax=Oceanobacillus piezotolerans TaxID=2448030 RepID=A0A498DRD4_9BACI|nr:flavin reductase family protein [Oceanobacillus piezotolerans]RLL47019.1 flavin reductase [Oceanobacillus piezotolerans]
MEDRKFRNAMGSFATGVTVITTEVDGNIHGMTANAFMSQSLIPKLVAISLKEDAHMLKKIKQSGQFCINVLSEDQQDLSKVFAGQVKIDSEIQFDYLDGKPVIPDALAQVACHVKSEYIEGDHTLFIGEVTDVNLEDGEPLIFSKGKYRTLEKLENPVAAVN